MPYHTKKKTKKVTKKFKRELPDNYRPALAEDVPEGRACGNCFFYNEDMVNEDRTKAWCEKWEEFVDGGYYCNAWQADEEERQVNLTPPTYMRAAARRGLELNRQGFGGDGLTEKTKREAREMAVGRVSADKWVRIAAWIARHLVDLDAPQNSDTSDSGYPGAGLVAHLLWGSGPSKARAIRTMNYAKSVVERLEKEEERHGAHDQSSHGAWAGGKREGKDLLENGTLQKGNSLDKSLSGKASKFNSNDFADGKSSPDLALQDLAERQKFTGKPQVATSQAEYDAIQSPKIESGPLKGQNVVKDKELHRGFSTTGDGKVSASTAKNEFEDGKYYAGKGLYGNGTYAAVDVKRAQKYAEGQSLENVSSFKLSPDAKIGSFGELSMQLAENKAGSRSLPESIEFDVGRYALAQGFDGYVVDKTKFFGDVQPSGPDQLVILNRTAIILPPKG